MSSFAQAGVLGQPAGETCKDEQVVHMVPSAVAQLAVDTKLAARESELVRAAALPLVAVR